MRQFFLNFEGGAKNADLKPSKRLIEDNGVPAHYKKHMARLMNLMSSIGPANSELCAKLLGVPREVIDNAALGKLSEAYRLMLGERADDGGIAIKLAARIPVLALIHKKLCGGDGERTIKMLRIIDDNNVPFTAKAIRTKRFKEACEKAAKGERLVEMLAAAKEHVRVFKNASELTKLLYEVLENIGAGRGGEAAMKLFIDKTLPRMVALTQEDKTGTAIFTLLVAVRNDLEGELKGITHHNYVVLLTDWLERVKEIPTDEKKLEDAIGQMRQFIKIKGTQERMRRTLKKGASRGTYAPDASPPQSWDDAVSAIEGGH